MVATDCGAINNMIQYNKYAANDTDAVTKAIKGGVNLVSDKIHFLLRSSYIPAVALPGQTALSSDLRNHTRISHSCRNWAITFSPLMALCKRQSAWAWFHSKTLPMHCGQCCAIVSAWANLTPSMPPFTRRMASTTLPLMSTPKSI